MNYCPQCGADTSYGGRPNSSPGSSIHIDTPALHGDESDLTATAGNAGWGWRAPALGAMALIPSVILASLIALFLPLSAATVAASVALAMAQLALVWVLTTRTWPVEPSLYGLTKASIPWWRALLLAAFALGASLGGAQLYVIAINALGMDSLVPPALPDDLVLPGGYVIFTVLALAVITPIAEEVFFRGFLQKGMGNSWGAAPGIILSAVVFAALHFQPAVVVPVFVTGLLLGALYWQTGSLWPGILVHGAQNLVAILGILLGL